jgi:cysteine synthase B
MAQELDEETVRRTERVSLELNIGETPLLRLTHVAQDLPAGVEIFAKAEHLNPGGSVKDRAALAMILDGERKGLLTPDKIILDATSGNTGIAYAMIGAARGYRVALCLPKNANYERKRILRLYGAEIIETDVTSGADGAQVCARELSDAEPEKFYYPDQYNNDANWRAHFHGTAPEIWRQSAGRVTHFLAGMGTSGTFTGTTRRLKDYNPAIRAISMQPDSPFHGLEGMKHMASALVPGIYDPTLADDCIEVTTEDAQEMTRRLAREEGLLVGVSSGANVFAALRLAHSLPAGSRIVTVLCDSGERYLGEEFWEE